MTKPTFILLSLFFISASVISQVKKYGETPEDSVKCVTNYSLYNEYFKQNAFKEALEPWRQTIKYCPKLSKSLYLNGLKMYESFVAGEKDAKMKNALIDSLLRIYDMRIENFDEKGYVLGRKGVDMLRFRKDKPKEAYETLKLCFELEGNKMEASAIGKYYEALNILVKNNQAAKEQMLELYPQLSEIVKYNINNTSKSDVKEMYTKVQENLDALFSPVAECSDLVKIYTAKFQATPQDTVLLERITRLFDKQNCTKEKLYYDAATALVKLKPSAEAYYSVGITSIQNDKYSDAAEYFKKASEMASDDALKVKALYKTAQCYLKLGQYNTVRTFAQKALSVNPGFGDAYIIIGDAYASSASQCGDNDCNNKAAYWLAVDKYEKARAVDTSVASDAASKIATYVRHFPGKEGCFFYNIAEGASYTVGCWINETTTVRFTK